MIALIRGFYKQFRKEIWLAILGFIIGAIIMYLSIAFVSLNPECVLYKNQDGAFYRIMTLSVGIGGSIMLNILFWENDK